MARRRTQKAGQKQGTAHRGRPLDPEAEQTQVAIDRLMAHHEIDRRNAELVFALAGQTGKRAAAVDFEVAVAAEKAVGHIIRDERKLARRAIGTDERVKQYVASVLREADSLRRQHHRRRQATTRAPAHEIAAVGDRWDDPQVHACTCAARSEPHRHCEVCSAARRESPHFALVLVFDGARRRWWMLGHELGALRFRSREAPRTYRGVWCCRGCMPRLATMLSPVDRNALVGKYGSVDVRPAALPPYDEIVKGAPRFPGVAYAVEPNGKTWELSIRLRAIRRRDWNEVTMVARCPLDPDTAGGAAARLFPIAFRRYQDAAPLALDGGSDPVPGMNATFSVRPASADVMDPLRPNRHA